MRQRERLATRSAALNEELATLEAEMHELDEQIDSLRALIGNEEPQRPQKQDAAPSSDGCALTGSAIRMAAVRVLADSGRAGAIHYREWFDLLRDAGYEVGGKRPDAVFLSQITRSPVVKATTKSGVYQLDFDAPERLSRDLEKLQRKLGALAAESSTNSEELAKRTALQEEIGLEIRRTQKALTEALKSLGIKATQSPVQLAA
jgi:hypothetical protein